MPAKAQPDRLSPYRQKRSFDQTPEPSGKRSRRKPKAQPSFCVQQHMARTLHYDLRLEHAGVLLSWAVPKGPSLNPKDRRRAVRTEDHPVDYGTFEGVIPQGYGAGVVLLWDRGTWTFTGPSDDIETAVEQGEIKFELDGVKLKGGWVLVRTGPAGEKAQWLLIKHRDAWSGEVDVTQAAPQSVKTWGGLAQVLSEHGVPAGWERQPPVKTGETGKRFRQLIARAKQHAADNTDETAGDEKRVKAATLPKSALQLGNRRLRLSNLQKPLYPTGFTKGQVIDYYQAVAPCILPHLRGRAVTLKRYPDGVNGKFFFEKRCPAHRPDWLETLQVQHSSGERLNYCHLSDISGLTWAANLAALELHVPLALANAPDVPTSMVFDLDPAPPAGLAEAAAVGLRLREMLADLGLRSLVKFSGSKGLHVYVPLNTPGVSFEQTKSFSRAVAQLLQRQMPGEVTAVMTRSLRPGKVFIDWSQNDQGKTTACVYTLRATDEPRVSAPLDWHHLPVSRLEDAATPEAVAARCRQSGDTFNALVTLRQCLPVLG